MEIVIGDGRRGGGHSVLRRWATTAVAMFLAAARVQLRPRVPARIPVSFIGRSRDRMGNSKSTNNRNVGDLNQCSGKNSGKLYREISYRILLYIKCGCIP
ncbi:hypothetical protein Hdeb2414_s0017g00513271 [Helianthus debilis subsp. tardiflorus]